MCACRDARWPKRYSMSEVARVVMLMAVIVAGTTILAQRIPAADVVVVDDWAAHTIGVRGVPTGWRTYETPGGRPAYDFTVTIDDGRRGLRLRSHDEHSTIARPLAVDLDTTPVLEWSWKIVMLPTGADVRRRETSDLTAHLFVVWPRFPAPLRSRLIGYIWDPVAPAGTIEKSRKTGTATFVILRSGTAELGRWITERRNVREDYLRIFGEAPDRPSALAVSIDTNDTHARAEGLIGRIAFAPR